MFRWYHEAAKCYVYLSDVSKGNYDGHDHLSRSTWKSDFRGSRWFTRGWTLQELIAPTSVEFYSSEGMRLGDKRSMEQQNHEITSIPVRALRGNPMSDFSIDERLSWAIKRETTHGEDKAYSLLGIFDISMPLIYGEGRERAFKRLKQDIYKRSWSRLDEPQNDRLEEQRDGRLEQPRNDQPPFTSEPLPYHPLADFGFRLFVLEPGVIESSITGHIQEFNLLSPPAYYALSYVWGQEPMIHRVIINGKTKFIQPNLFHALQRIRPRTGQYRIWVDSLCINQLDSSERNMQVRQMATIYGRACGVLVWLGEEDSTSKFALDFVPQIISRDFQWDGAWWEQYGFTALAQILERPWFRRGWILQEAAFSKNSTIHCGDRQVYMDHFVMAIDLVRARLSTLPPSFGRTTNAVRIATLADFHDSPAIRLLDTIEGAFRKSANGDILHRRMSLETLVALGTFSETTDQRDTIYALLNLASDIVSFSRPDQSDAIIPDYGKVVLDVFVDFILHCCRSGTLDIVCRPWAPVSSSSVYAIGNDNRVDHILRTYPSWIASRDNLPFGNPRWRFESSLTRQSVCRWRSKASLQCPLRIEASGFCRKKQGRHV